MKTFHIKKGLDIPISGAPTGVIRKGNKVGQVAIVADDYIGMKPTMLVKEGDRVALGQALFTDKKNEGIVFTSPGCGIVSSINRGAKRKFESIIIRLDGDKAVEFCTPAAGIESYAQEDIRELLIKSGLWTTLRTRPYGKNPAIDSNPSSLFITAADSAPLAADPQVIIENSPENYQLGLKVLRKMLLCPINYCTGADTLLECEMSDGLDYYSFKGPHPSGLPSTHIHFIDPVSENKTVWHIGYQDVIAIGHLFTHGQLATEKVISLCGAGTIDPSLVSTRIGASLAELCRRELSLDDSRIISGSVLSGRKADGITGFLGRFHDQVSVIYDSSGRSIFNWLLPGLKRFSLRPVFASAYVKDFKIPMNTALWGGERAIYPLGTYDEVMPLDIIATSLLKSISKGDTEKSVALGCLELIEDDLGLCGFVCPGKNEFGPVLRNVLTAIELGG
ncbi:MAG: Na+-transporting NADH:ubiquinone oxidoreductase subunit A [Desulforhopalus sp.]|jgi:Na+-transporting NADH:ubiquinone oxidoreductase subunit A